jgi:hypothetical protein
MRPIACLLALAVSLCAASLALAQDGMKDRTASAPSAAPAAPVLVSVLGADMSTLCHDADIERARRVAEACDGKTRCRFTPETGTEASEACARDSVVLWNCGDGRTRQSPLAPEPGQSREIVMECPQPAVAAVAAVKPAPKDGTETVNAEGRMQELATVRPAAKPLIDMSEAGVDAELTRMEHTKFDDPRSSAPPAVRLNDIHRDLWKAPDHSPSVSSPGRWGPVP